MPTPTATMSGLFLRPRHARKVRIAVCQFCKAVDKVSYSTSLKQRALPGSSLSHDANSTLSRSNNKTRYWSSRFSSVTILRPSRRLSSTTPNVEATVTEIQEKFEALRHSKKAAPEEEVIALLQQCLHVVEAWTKAQHPHDSAQNPTPTGTATTAASSLLDLNEKRVGFNHSKESKTPQSRIVDTISNLSTELLVDERVFISPAALDIYTKINLLIKRADYFHLIFSLYAQKPIPIANTDPVQFRPPSPNSVKNAVPSKLANEALGIALEQKNLSLALAIIDATFCMPAFTRAKLLKNAAVPLAGLATAPLASYAVATWAASLQNTMDASMATGITFTATLAYIGFTSSVGVIAVATSNDQMERVSWAPGIPLRQRWLREEERGALDKVAMAWGFKDPYRRGEEEGEEWEDLREFIGMRGMILDKTELMEGMQ